MTLVTALRDLRAELTSALGACRDAEGQAAVDATSPWAIAALDHALTRVAHHAGHAVNHALTLVERLPDPPSDE